MIKIREARFWPKMKFEPIFFQVLWWFTFSFPLSGEADGGSGIHPTQNGRGEIRYRHPTPVIRQGEKLRKILFYFFN